MKSMKKSIALITLVLLVAACGTKTTEPTETTLTAEQEMVVADSLSTDIEKTRQELEADTEQNLAEIDSLLENF